MKTWDPAEAGADPQAWLADLRAWRLAQHAALQRQVAARRALDIAEQRARLFADWVSRATGAAARLRAQSAALAAADAAIAALDADLAQTESDLRERHEARDTACSRLLDGPDVGTPIVLLPLRLQTSWQGSRLRVRIYPDEIAVDRHEPRLTPAEQTAAAAYWATLAGPAGPGGDPAPAAARAAQAWRDLVRATDAQRAAWLVTRTAPGSAPLTDADLRPSPWDIAVRARLLPARFAVLALNGGEPVNLAAGGQPARYAAWTEPVTAPLPVSVLHEPGEGDWAVDFDTALAAGMGVAIDVPSPVTSIDELVVVGVRDRASLQPDDGETLAALLRAHAYSVGLEVLQDGTPTNNSAAIRAAHSPAQDSAVAADLAAPFATGAAPGLPAPLPDGSAGAQLADLLGLDRRTFADVTGAAAPRDGLQSAISLLVRFGVTGALPTGFAPGPDAWPDLRPGGPAPALRVGRQPYGVLPASIPGRWVAGADGSVTLGPAVSQAARAIAVPLDADPAAPAQSPSARQGRPEDIATLEAVLDETASSLSWASPDGSAQYSGPDGLVGTAEGPGSPAAYLRALARATAATFAVAAAEAPETLLARVAVSARGRSLQGHGPDADVVAALSVLADHAGTAAGRDDLARVLGDYLDAASHRIDAWVTAAVTGRARAAAQQASGHPAVGAYGYLTDVRPRTQPKTHGHVHAPSLAHAATAAVLRAGYLGQRRAAWAARVLAAQQAGGAALAEARAGLAALAPLDDATEARLPLAVDVSSRRVRDSRWVLEAVRVGQPLAAVLGYQVERDLADRGLQRYLAAFRKLTRFETGTALEALEARRRAAQERVEADLAQAAALEDAATQAAQAVASVHAELTAAQSRAALAAEAAAVFAGWRAELGELDGTTIPHLRAQIAELDADRPAPKVARRRIQVP
jgi:hypothetical protein